MPTNLNTCRSHDILLNFEECWGSWSIEMSLRRCYLLHLYPNLKPLWYSHDLHVNLKVYCLKALRVQNAPMILIGCCLFLTIHCLKLEVWYLYYTATNSKVKCQKMHRSWNTLMNLKGQYLLNLQVKAYLMNNSGYLNVCCCSNTLENLKSMHWKHILMFLKTRCLTVVKKLDLW